MSKVRVLYDFDGDTENGELVIKEDEFITVLNEEIGDGWWEGKNSKGDSGLFPKSYVEVMDSTEDVTSDAAALNGYQAGTENGAVDEDQFQQEHGYPFNSFSHHEDANNFDDEEEEDQETQQKAGGYYNDEEGESKPGERDDVNSPGGRSNSQLTKAGTVKKNINRFSPFVKTGSEAFILGNIPGKVSIKSTDKLKIIVSPENTPMWEPSAEPFTIDVTNPEKKKKFKGMKSFTAFSVIPSSTGRAVSRRYKHYEWLHERFEEKFNMHFIPPLPDKQYYGRYGEEFVEKRREKLQGWSNRIARHPILSRSNVFSHFILCDEEGSQWKTGKRRAEKDDIIGAAYLHTIEHPDVSIDINAAESNVDAFSTFIRHFKLSLSKMRVKFIDHSNQMSGPFMAEFHKMASVINGLATTFALENHEYAKSLTEAIYLTARTYNEIGKMHAEQPRYDILPALDMMKEYLGLVFTLPEVGVIHKGVVSKVRDCGKMKDECRIDITDATEINSRSESVSAAIQAEIYHFQHERIIDFREMMKSYLDEQIKFYTEVTSKLHRARALYNDGTDL